MEPMAPRDCPPPFGEPQGPRRFRTGGQGPFIPQAAPWTPALPPLPGHAFKPERGFRAPDGRRRKQMRHPLGPGDPAQTRAPPARGGKTGTRAPSSGREPRHARARAGCLSPSLSSSFPTSAGSRERMAPAPGTDLPPKPPPLAAGRPGPVRLRPRAAAAPRRVPPQDPPRLRSRLTVNRIRGSRG